MYVHRAVLRGTFYLFQCRSVNDDSGGAITLACCRLFSSVAKCCEEDCGYVVYCEPDRDYDCQNPASAGKPNTVAWCLSPISGTSPVSAKARWIEKAGSSCLLTVEGLQCCARLLEGNQPTQWLEEENGDIITGACCEVCSVSHGILEQDKSPSFSMPLRRNIPALVSDNGGGETPEHVEFWGALTRLCIVASSVKSSHPPLV